MVLSYLLIKFKPVWRGSRWTEGLLQFVARLRELCDAKPVDFKLCIGDCSESLSICKAMIDSGIAVDFITVDGTEGGKGGIGLSYVTADGTRRGYD